MQQQWAFKLTRLWGIDVYVHYTFFLLLLYFAWQGYSVKQSIFDAADGVLFICALFTCVTLHEYGHALMARRFHIKTQHITLLPIGGVAAIEKTPDKPWQEVLVATAGPAVNVVIAVLIYAWLRLNPQEYNAQAIMQGDYPLLIQLLMVNVFLAVFNLIPAFPMDGGRVLRALLATRLDMSQATAWATKIGKVFAILFALYGVYSNNFILTFVAIFLWLGGHAENRSTQLREKVKSLPLSQIMRQQFYIAPPNEALESLLQKAEQYRQADFPVGDSFTIQGVVSYKSMQKALGQNNQASVADCELASILTVNVVCSIQSLVSQLKANPHKMVAVEEHGKIVGLIEMQQVLQLAQL